MPQPADVEYRERSIVALFEEPKVALVIDLDDPDPPAEGERSPHVRPVCEHLLHKRVQRTNIRPWGPHTRSARPTASVLPRRVVDDRPVDQPLHGRLSSV